MLVLEVDWAKARVIGPSSGSLLSQSTYVSMIVTERNKGGREWRGGRRENKEGKGEADC